LVVSLLLLKCFSFAVVAAHPMLLSSLLVVVVVMLLSLSLVV